MDNSGPQRTNASQRAKEHRCRVDDNRRCKVLINNFHCTAANLQRVTQLARVFGANRNRCRFSGNIRFVAAQAYADVSKCQCRRVINTVADHHDVAAFLQFHDIVGFIFRQNFSMIRINIHIMSYFCGHCFGIAGQHDDFVDTYAAHLIQRLFHSRTNRVFNGQAAYVFLISCNIEQVFAP